MITGCSEEIPEERLDGGVDAQPEPKDPWDVIRTETLRPESETYRPLPLAAHWNTGLGKDGFDPDYQIAEIKKGALLLPWFQLPEERNGLEDPTWINYYEPGIKEAARLHLPISFIATQWEWRLTTQDRFIDLPKADNPNVIHADGTLEKRLSPFGNPTVWRSLGQEVTATPFLKRLQELYPDPPKVFFISNNEHMSCCSLPWMNVDQDVRFKDQPGSNDTSNFSKVKFAQDGYSRLYRALQEGLRDGLINSSWRANAVFIGYDAFGPRHYARWVNWQEYAMSRPGKISPAPDMWDGGSPSYYLFNWDGAFDTQVYSPQVEAMNWDFMLKEAHRINPKFWFELSTWDGNEPESGDGTEKDANGNGGFNIDKRKLYSKSASPFTPARYSGMVQFGMWLLRPRVVREFRGYLDTRKGSEPYFSTIVDAVGRVHRQPVLREFWRSGKLVVNPAHPHPYRTIELEGYTNEERWFGLDTSVDTVNEQSGLTTPISVFALALVTGETGNRRWLVYAHAPNGTNRNVTVTVPGYGNATLPDVTATGSFYLVAESTRLVSNIDDTDQTGVQNLTNIHNSASFGRLVAPGSTAFINGKNLAGVDKLSFDVVTSFGANGQQRTINCATSGSAEDPACKITYVGENQINFIVPALSATMQDSPTLPVTLGMTLKAWSKETLVAQSWIPLLSSVPAVLTAAGNGTGAILGNAVHRNPADPTQDVVESLYKTSEGSVTANRIVKKQAQLLLSFQISGWKPPANYIIRRGDEPTQNYCSAGAGDKQILLDQTPVPIIIESINADSTQVVVDASAVAAQVTSGEKLFSVTAKMKDCFGIDRISNVATVLFGAPL